jgi:hypothetical protein
MLDEMYRYHGERQKATFTRWGDKTPMNVGCMDSIIDIFPRARFVHLLRDGVDVAYSWSRVEKYAGEIVEPSRRWVRSVEAVRQFSDRKSDRTLEVRYEHLCRYPEKTLRRVCKFIDLSFDEELITRTDHHDELSTAQSVPHYRNAFDSISTDSIGNGREGLSRTQKKTLAPLLNEELARQGYEPLEA